MPMLPPLPLLLPPARYKQAKQKEIAQDEHSQQTHNVLDEIIWIGAMTQ
jgi:hypothetical protein